MWAKRRNYLEISDATELAEMIEEDADWRDVRQVRDFLALLKRGLVLHADKISLIIAFGAVIGSVSLLNDLLVLFVIVGLIMPRGLNTIGLIVVFFCQMVTFFLYANQFKGFIYFLQTYLFSNNDSLTQEWMSWIGIPYSTNLIHDCVMYNLLMAALLVERIANRWRKDADIVSLKTEYGEPCPLFLVSKSRLRKQYEDAINDHENPVLSQKNLQYFVDLGCWYTSNFYRKHGTYVSSLFVV